MNESFVKAFDEYVRNIISYLIVILSNYSLFMIRSLGKLYLIFLWLFPSWKGGLGVSGWHAYYPETVYSFLLEGHFGSSEALWSMTRHWKKINFLALIGTSTFFRRGLMGVYFHKIMQLLFLDYLKECFFLQVSMTLNISADLQSLFTWNTKQVQWRTIFFFCFLSLSFLQSGWLIMVVINN